MKRFVQLGALILVLCLAVPALSMELDEAKSRLDAAKQQGLVGETPTGYLEVVRAEGNAQGIVDAINKARRDEYARIAEKYDIPVTQVETVAGQKALNKTPPGQLILVDGEWVKK
ncbi:YdbL family probable chaperone protein [Marinobacter orientalis]|uniref:YdbL family protein n=1 Tax=Marinobacter orientalis TaxID=1928859 RepID=A0A7Y0RDL3_9GAMM|nr:YdbL family protein [Marinobacter orientalis]NMT64278.1 YdbL family protein [Marinobacter orientalis]TGX49495.1 DUF1318 domain-containing protein [Marinobacter orientalis]